MSVKFPFAERFKAPQGEGIHTGVQMAFARLVGCSVGQKVCVACDTDFATLRVDLGGGLYTAEETLAWAAPCGHLCVTGGEPLDRDIRPLLFASEQAGILPHVETSGTKKPEWLDPHPAQPRKEGYHAVGANIGDGRLSWAWRRLWLTVSPKPGYLPEMIAAADEVKFILGGLGDGPGWPQLEDALAWAAAGKLVYVQPRNERLTVNRDALTEALAVVAEHPQLRLSCQLHKFVGTR